MQLEADIDKAESFLALGSAVTAETGALEADAYEFRFGSVLELPEKLLIISRTRRSR